MAAGTAGGRCCPRRCADGWLRGLWRLTCLLVCLWWLCWWLCIGLRVGWLPRLLFVWGGLVGRWLGGIVWCPRLFRLWFGAWLGIRLWLRFG